MQKIKKLYHVFRNNGLGFCAFRAQYELRRKLGLLKRKFPPRKYSEISLADYVKPRISGSIEDLLRSQEDNNRCFFFKAGAVESLNSGYKDKILLDANEILQNKFRYFFDKSYDLGNGPDWFLNPVTGRRAKGGQHWCDIGSFDSDTGDIKFIWEPSRFGWAYTLARAYVAGGDEKYAEKFWELFESWLNSNPFNIGPNYVCGQECAIRVMAMSFALFALVKSSASTKQRLENLVKAIIQHAYRIEKNISFAISTRTNHSITEAAGLYTVGVLFPQFKRADRWIKFGKKILTREGLKQIYSDGSYIQHSMNYHRLMLQNFLWVLRLGELNQESFVPELISKVKKATEFLYQMQDKSNGRVANYGANDGALIMPLNNCDYHDFRPVVQAMYYLLNRKKLFENGPWDEDMVWFFGCEALAGKPRSPERQSSRYDCGGYYTLVNDNSWAMMRCHSFRNRPGHADMLHLDLWWKGLNILRDSGSYMYNCDEPWQSYFGSTAAHNTIVIDQNDQMRKVSRFMWLDWTKAKLIMCNANKSRAKVIQGEHYGYCRGKEKIVHRRAVLSLEDDFWIIVDDVLGSGSHKIELCWQLCDAGFELKDTLLKLQTDSGPVSIAIFDSARTQKCECFRGADRPPMGWESIYYGNRKPSPALVYSERAVLPVRLVTIIGLGDVVKSTALREGNIVSLISRTTGLEWIIVLNSIDNSDKNTFIYIQRGTEKIFLD